MAVKNLGDNLLVSSISVNQLFMCNSNIISRQHWAHFVAESPCTFFQTHAVKYFADINYWTLRHSFFLAYRSAVGSLTSPHVINRLAVLSWRQYGGLTRLTLLPPYEFLNRATNVKHDFFRPWCSKCKKMSDLFITRCDGFLSPWPCRDWVHMFFMNKFVLFNCDKPVYIRKTICCY